MSWLAFIPVVGGYLASLWIVVQSINKRIDSLDGRVGAIESRMGNIERSLGVIEERTATIVAAIDQHDMRLRGGGL